MMMSYLWLRVEKNVFASSKMMWLRGSAKALVLRGAKRREASAIAGSISIVSTERRALEPRSVCVVSPVPIPMTAALVASGLYARGIAAVSVIVISSETRVERGSCRDQAFQAEQGHADMRGEKHPQNGTQRIGRIHRADRLFPVAAVQKRSGDERQRDPRAEGRGKHDGEGDAVAGEQE